MGYEVLLNDVEVASGGSFGASESTTFGSCGSTDAPTISPSKSPTMSPTRAPVVSGNMGIATCGRTKFVNNPNPNPGTSGCTTHEESISRDSKRAVRCCADTDLGSPWRKHNGCSVWGGTKKIVA